MAFDKKTLVLPKGTVFEEHIVTTPGDVILGNHVKCSFGFQTERRVFVGQGVEVATLEAGSDVRIDQSSHVGAVASDANVYVGERCFVQGDLRVGGDLDVGDDVRVGGTLDAKGWVQKRNPVPLVMYLFIYLLELMRMGQSEEVEKILKELEDTDQMELAVDEVFLFIPDGCVIGQDWDVKGALRVGDDVRILGNVTVQGSADLGDGVVVLGALRVEGAVTLGANVEVQGELRATEGAILGTGSHVCGVLHAASATLYPGAKVDGKIMAERGVEFRTEAPAKKTSDNKIEEFQGKAADLADLLG